MTQIEPESLGPCPNCEGQFESVRVGMLTIDRCVRCGGLWLDERELDKVLEMDRRALKQKRAESGQAPQPGGAKGKCPRCNGTLIQLTNLRANIKTDSCTVCYGIFLDAGELEAFDHPNLAGRIGGLLRKLLGRR